LKVALYVSAIIIAVAVIGRVTHGAVLAIGTVALLGWMLGDFISSWTIWVVRKFASNSAADETVDGAEAAAPAAVAEIPLYLGTPEAVAVDAALEETEAAVAPVPDRWAAYDSPAVYRRNSKWRADQVVWPAVPLDGIQLADVVRVEAPNEEIATPFDGLEPAVLPAPAMLAEMVS
jgi:hypothetical protein